MAIGLAECGFRVFATGRTIGSVDLRATVDRIRCDHLRDEDTAAALDLVAGDGALDVLVNNAWGGYERMVEGGRCTWGLPFWEQPSHRWTAMMDAGVRAAFVTAAGAVPSGTSASGLRRGTSATQSLYPGLVRTEAVLRAAEGGWLNLENSESPQFIGRVIAALNGDLRLMDRVVRWWSRRQRLSR